MTRRTVFRDRGNIFNQGNTVKSSWGGWHDCSMTCEEEGEFLAQREAKAIVAGVPYGSTHSYCLVECLGHVTPTSTTYRLLSWLAGVVQLDTKHPKDDFALQDVILYEAFRCQRLSFLFYRRSLGGRHHLGVVTYEIKELFVKTQNLC